MGRFRTGLRAYPSGFVTAVSDIVPLPSPEALYSVANNAGVVTGSLSYIRLRSLFPLLDFPTYSSNAKHDLCRMRAATFDNMIKHV